MYTEADLSIQDFTKYFDKKKLGRLYFPNGICHDYRGERWTENVDIVPFFVKLKELYELVIGWKINSTEVPLDDIIAIIAFGSAVRHPGHQIEYKVKKKYVLWGDTYTEEKKVPIQPKDADFLVITESNYIKEKILRPLSMKTYDSGTWITKGGIHVVNRGVEQIINGTTLGDTISISAIKEGVPIFCKGEFNSFYRKFGVEKETPRKILWNEDDSGKLIGKIN